MNCEFLHQNILHYLDKTLGKVEADSIEKHLTQCKSCAELLIEVSATYATTELDRTRSANSEFSINLMRSFRRMEDPTSLSIIPQILKPLAIAASISLGIIIGNTELDLILGQNEVIDLSENFTPATAEDYSVWTLLEDEDGN